MSGQVQWVEAILYGERGGLDRWKDDLALLMTTPGVDRLTALTILAELGEYRKGLAGILFLVPPPAGTLTAEVEPFGDYHAGRTSGNGSGGKGRKPC